MSISDYTVRLTVLAITIVKSVTTRISLPGSIKFEVGRKRTKHEVDCVPEYDFYGDVAKLVARTRFRIWRPKGRVGSSPTIPTIFLILKIASSVCE